MVSKCTPICPFRAFVCTKRALSIRKRGIDLVAFCSWTGDECTGYKCQFALCTRHALLPDGTCRLTIKTRQVRRPSIEEEALKIEHELSTLKGKLKKLGVDIERLE